MLLKLLALVTLSLPMAANAVSAGTFQITISTTYKDSGIVHRALIYGLKNLMTIAQNEGCEITGNPEIEISEAGLLRSLTFQLGSSGKIAGRLTCAEPKFIQIEGTVQSSKFTGPYFTSQVIDPSGRVLNKYDFSGLTLTLSH